MGDFMGNAAANLIGTFVGAGLAVLTAWALARRQRASMEVGKLQRLIDRIYRSRALRKVSIGPRRRDALTEEIRVDFDRVTSAVLVIRNLVEDAANTLDPRAPAVPVLDSMYGAILRYLSAIQADDRDYVNNLMQLREELLSGELDLQRLHPKLILREPGAIEVVRRGESRR